MPTEAVLDTNVVASLLRAPKQKRRGPRQSTVLESPLDTFFRRGVLTVHLDKTGGLLDEWRRTVGVEAVNVVLAQWEALGGVVIVDSPASLPPAVARELRAHGFSDTVDKLILRIASTLNQGTVVTSDPDFWNPRNNSQRGHDSAPVATLCRECLGVRIVLLAALIQMLNRRPRRR